MEKAFDAYHTWLGIPPEEQPPDHYRLLGIRVFEDNDEVISNAADRQMLLLRTLQTGRHAQLSQQLLNEVAAAKVCLLNPEKKRAYDAALEQRPAPAGGQASTPTSEAQPPAAVPSIQIRTGPAARAASTRASKKGFGWLMAAGGAVGVVLLVTLAIILSHGADEAVQTPQEPRPGPLAKPKV